MKILFVHPVSAISTSDVARGYRSALERQGHDIKDYNMIARFDYHNRAIPTDVVMRNPDLLSRQASETILNEALYHQADMVLIISGLNVHPIALWLLGKAGIPAAIIFTESPYDDEQQAQWADLSHVGGSVDLTVFANDRYSAIKYGWNFLEHAYDPAIHRPVPAIAEEACDVLMVATGWQERQAFLEAVDWTGIDLRLYGIWPGLQDKPDSPIHRYYRPMVVDNARIASTYCSARICLNFHRRSDVALSAGPRAYEIAACGAFQLSDARQDLVNLFGSSVPTFSIPAELGDLVRFYLANIDEREIKAARSREAVRDKTFDYRATELVAILQRNRSVHRSTFTTHSAA